MAGEERHVLGLSGGRDSAALAVHMRQNAPRTGHRLLLHRHRQRIARGLRVSGEAGRFLGQTNLATQSGSRLRLLVEAVQQLFAVGANPVVHSAAQAPPFRAVDSAMPRRR